MSLLAQDERLARRVGAVALCVLGAAIAFFVLVFGKLEWGDKIRVAIYLRATGGLQEGAPLVVAGREVGHIVSIARAPHGAAGPLGGEEGIVATVAIAANDARRIRHGVDVFVASRGVLSSRYLELGPIPADGAVLAEGDALLGHEPPSLDRVLHRTWNNLMTMKQFVEAVRPELDQLRDNLVALDDTLATLAPAAAGVPALGLQVELLIGEARRAYDEGLGGAPGLARIEAVMSRARGTFARARRTIEALRARATALADATAALRARTGERGGAAIATIELAIARTRAAIAGVDPLLAKVEELQGRLARGEGSLGRLMTDPEFPEDAKELGKILKRKPWRVIAKPRP